MALSGCGLELVGYCCACDGENPSSAVVVGVAFVTRIGGACNLNGEAVVLLTLPAETGVNCVGLDPLSAAEYTS